MRFRLLLLTLLFLVVAPGLQAQSRLSGTQNLSGKSMTSSGRYEQVNWEIMYRLETSGTTARLVFYNPKVTVAPTSTYRNGGVGYTPAMLGLGSWPNPVQRPCNVAVRVQVSHNGRTTEAQSSCNCDGSCPDNPYSFDTSNGLPKVVGVLGMDYNDTPDDALDRLIEAKKNGRTASAGTSAAGASLPGSSSPVYSPSAAPASSNALETTAAVVNATAPLLNQMLDNMLAKQEARAKAAAAENDAAITRRIEGKQQRFRDEYYANYIAKANQGDEQAQMTLYFACKALLWTGRDKALDAKLEAWFKKAFANKNPDAMLETATDMIKGSDADLAAGMKVWVYTVEQAAARGSVDVLYMMGNYYNMKPGSYGTKKYPLEWKFGGNDPAKAFEYFTKAAALGSPAALHQLGMIYKYGTTYVPANALYKKLNRNYYVSYVGIAPLDEQKAFECFVKSVQPDYKPSLYARIAIQEVYKAPYEGSRFNPINLVELANFYQEGKVVAKDKKKAAELLQMKKDYENAHHFDSQF